jgi:hypothetical protein
MQASCMLAAGLEWWWCGWKFGLRELVTAAEQRSGVDVTT